MMASTMCSISVAAVGSVLFLFSGLVTALPASLSTTTVGTTTHVPSTRIPTPSSLRPVEPLGSASVKPKIETTIGEVSTESSVASNNAGGKSIVAAVTTEPKSVDTTADSSRLDGDIPTTGNLEPKNSDRTSGNTSPESIIPTTAKDEPINSTDITSSVESKSASESADPKSSIVSSTIAPGEGYPQGPCTPGTTKSYRCNSCTCVLTGTAYSCTKISCPILPSRCNPGSTWTEKCNSCRCTAIGFPSCTEMKCDTQKLKMPDMIVPKHTN